MRLEISYRTRYEYEPAVQKGVTALRLRPAPREGLLVESSVITAHPGRVVSSSLDGWGTMVDLVEFASSHRTAEFTVKATVETLSNEHPTEPRADELHLYRNDSPRVRMAAVEGLGWAPDAGNSWAAVDSALAWIPQRFVYTVGATDAETSIEEVIANGSGVCQDFAHIFLAMLRRWGWCARYVSGYFFNSPEAETPRIEAEAMHAWVEVFLPGVGWVGLDATAGQYADERYVPVGVGRDYHDVSPVRGIIHGDTSQSQSARLEMVKLSQQQQQQQ